MIFFLSFFFIFLHNLICIDKILCVLVSEANQDSMRQLEAQAKAIAEEAARDQPTLTRGKVQFVR